MADVKVSNEEIAKVEAQVKAAEQSERAKLEENVRKELAAEAKAKELEAQNAALQKAAADAKAEAEKAKADAEAMIKAQVEQRLKLEQEARSKAIVDNTNPFNKGTEKKPQFTPEVVSSIDRASYEAFRAKQNEHR